VNPKEGGDPILEQRPLTRRQRLFVEFYLQTWNATEAARLAGYREPNKQGPRLLVNVGIREQAEKRMAELSMPTDAIIARLNQHADADIRQFFKVQERWTEHPLPSDEILGEEEREMPVGFDGEIMTKVFYLVRRIVLDMHAIMDPTKSRLIKEYPDSPKDGIRVRIHDSQAALVLLGKHRQLFTDKLDVTSGGEKLPAPTVNVYIPDNGRGDRG
jgi:phage terminase small subunit